MRTFVFGGQGSQFVGMGKEFFGKYPSLVQEADDILGYSIEKLCLEDPEKKLDLTQFTQPALYVVSMLEYYDKIQSESEPDYVIGHSAGEYAALCAAGAFSFGDGLKIVKERGRLMAEQSGGGMAAIIGLNQKQVEGVIEKHDLKAIDIANLNTEKQIVISGPIDDVKACESVFLAEGASAFIVLKVSGAFHSRYMIDAQEKMKVFIDDVSINKMNKTVISNYTARPYEEGKTRNTLIPQMSNSVKWVESVRYLMSYEGMEFVKIGPGVNTINLVNRILKEMQPLSESEREKQLISVKPDDANKVAASVDVEIMNKCEENRFDFLNDKECINTLGSPDFREKYRVKYSYIIGGMGKGISGSNLVAKVCNNGILGFLGTEGLEEIDVERMIKQTQSMIKNDSVFGINITQDYFEKERIPSLVDICLKYNVKAVEISNFISITKDLVRYKVKGMRINEKGQYEGNSIVAKVSQTALASEFLKPAADDILRQLLNENEINMSEYELAKKVPLVDDLCLLGDCAYETERGNLVSMLDEVLSIRKRIVEQSDKELLFIPRVGCAGGIGTPKIAAMYFYMGADFVLTGSINQCATEAVLAKSIKCLLNGLTVCDCTYVPSEKFFELDKNVQVVKKGVFFPSRAKLLKSLYEVNDSIDMISDNMKTYLKNKMFHMDLEDYYQNMKKTLNEKQVVLADANPKYKMALIFKQYIKNAFMLATDIGDNDTNFVDVGLYCSSALGCFNEAVKGTYMEDYSKLSVVDIADYIMSGAKEIANINK